MNVTLATVLTGLGAAILAIGLIGLLRPRMYESMMLRPSAKGPIKRLRLIAIAELALGALLMVVGIVGLLVG